MTRLPKNLKLYFVYQQALEDSQQYLMNSLTLNKKK